MILFKLKNNQQGSVLVSIVLVGCSVWLTFVSEQVGAECKINTVLRRKNVPLDHGIIEGDLLARFPGWTKPSPSEKPQQQQEQQQQQQQQQQQPKQQQQQQQQIVQKESESKMQKRQKELDELLEPNDCTGLHDIDEIFLSDEQIQRQKEQKALVQPSSTATILYLSHPENPPIIMDVPPSVPDNKSLSELKPGDDVAKYLFNRKEPGWMDACQRRPEGNKELSFFGPDAPKVKPLPKWEEEERRRRLILIDAVLAERNKTLSALGLDNIGHRRGKRSINSSTGGIKLYKLNGNDPDKSTMLVKQQAPVGKAKWSTKKTSFSMSQMKLKHKKAKIRYINSGPFTQYPNQLEQVGTSSTAAPTTTPAPTTMTPEQTEVDKKINDVVTSMYVLEIKMSWGILGALNTLDDVNKTVTELRNEIQGSTSAATHGRAEVSPERVDQIVGGKRRWLPHLGDLVLGDYPTSGSEGPRSVARAAGLFNITGGLYDPRLKALMFNLTQYMEFFAVALEQMRYDQETVPNEQRYGLEDRHYKNLETFILRMLCEAEVILMLESEFMDKKREFYNLSSIYQPKTVENLPRFYEELIGGKLARERKYTGGNIDSAIRRAFVALDPNEKFQVKRTMARFTEQVREYEMAHAIEREVDRLNEMHKQRRERDRKIAYSNDTIPVHIWRDIMPLEQRQLHSINERSIRDQSILKDLDSLIDCYSSLLHSNLANSSF